MSQLTDIIFLLYQFQEEDVDDIARRLAERMKATWVNTLTDLAGTHGCKRYASTPKGEYAKTLTKQATVDAQSIVNTYNRELRNQIERLYKANPKGNRSYYFSNLEKWNTKRDGYKAYQIALATDSYARQYAQQQFYMHNLQLARSFAASGPPAVCKICIMIFAAGIVNFEYTQSHPLPAHYQCPHLYKVLTPIKANCQLLWLGG